MTQTEIIHNGDTPEYYFEEGCHITEWLNSAADGEVSIARARVAPGVTTRLHRLHGVTERYLVLAGRGRVNVGDREPDTVAGGDVVVIPPGIPQQITNIGRADLVFLAICTPRFSTSAYEDLDRRGA